jgi:hypothetical protein
MIKLKSVTFDLLLLNMMNLMMSHEYRSVIRQQSQSVINYRHLRISRPVSRRNKNSTLLSLCVCGLSLSQTAVSQSVTKADRVRASTLAFNSKLARTFFDNINIIVGRESGAAEQQTKKINK